MKTKLLTLFVLFCLISVYSQTDGWRVFSKATEITKIVPDDVNANEMHLATDFGYIKYNTATNTVVDYLNLTSQTPAIGTVKDIALDPTSNNIALTLKDGIAIYDGLSVSYYNYNNSDLTIGELTSQFYYLQVDYAINGSLYIYKKDAFGYQKFSGGIFDAEMTTAFRPQDIVENNCGTKAYFAGDNNGLWELDKTTDTWTNFTSSNSNLFQNFLTSLAMDNSDNLYIGHYQGLSKFEPDQNITNCNATSPIPVFDININPINGVLLVTNSQTSSASIFGLSLVDFNICSWVNYREDGINCLNENVINACNYDSSGAIYAAPTNFSDPGKVIHFNPGNFCTPLDIDYIDVPEPMNTFNTGDFAIRQKTTGEIEVGIIKSDKVHMLEFELGVGNNYTGYITVDTAENSWSITSDNDYFVVETNTGWSFINGNNSINSFAHGLPNHLAYVSKKTSVGESDNGIIAIMHKGFDAAYNYLVYQTICDLPNSTCSTPQEILNNDRDLSQDTSYGGRATNLSGLQVPNLRALAISSALPPDTGKVINIVPDENSNAPSSFAVSIDPSFVPVSDPVAMHIPNNSDDNFSFLVANKTTQELLHVTLDENGNDVFHPIAIDENNDGNNDEIGTTESFVITSEEGEVVGNAFVIMFAYFSTSGRGLTSNTSRSMRIYAVSPDTSNSSFLMVEEINSAMLDNDLPKDLSISKALFKQYSPTEGLFTLLTNYGILVKTGVDISQLTLSDNDFEPNGGNITLFPNPSSDIVSFSNDQIDSAMVYDLNGRLILTASENTFSVKNLNTGIYTVKAKLNNGLFVVRKLIKN
ncbi:T9SS type A sorting domain-containing protein [Winogradskyella pulchriflava]|uniref:T9SS type A sorting domain-containing protein n=1 Tax=Winogradskyella pulchriflava TaxID=1110688 RepID=A0ABV6Q5B7_9FLAO